MYSFISEPINGKGVVDEIIIKENQYLKKNRIYRSLLKMMFHSLVLFVVPPTQGN